jgi:antitoxin VapB
MKQAKLFTNGQSQAVRLPKEFRFKGKEVNIKKMGVTVILSPIEDSIDRFWNTLNGFQEINIKRNQPKHSDTREKI